MVYSYSRAEPGVARHCTNVQRAFDGSTRHSRAVGTAPARLGRKELDDRRLLACDAHGVQAVDSR